MRMLLLGLLILATTHASASTLVVANKSDDTVDLIDPRTGEIIVTMPTGKAPHEVEVSPDGQIAVVANYGDRENPGSSLTVIDLPTRSLIRTVDLGEHLRPHGLAWYLVNQVIVTTEGSKHVLIVDISQDEIVAALPTEQSVSHMVAVMPDRSRFFVANIGSGTMTAIDPRTQKKLKDVETGAGAEGIAVTPDGSEVWVTNREAGTISVIDTESLEILDTIASPGFPIRIEFSPDGAHALVSAAQAGEIVRIDVAERKEVARAKLDLSTVADDAKRLFTEFGDSPVPVGIQFAADGSRAYIAATQSDAVVVIDPETLEVRGLLKAGREPDGMGWSHLRE